MQDSSLCCQRHPLSLWSPLRGELEPSMSLVDWFDHQLARMQEDLIQHRFFDVPELERMDLDHSRRSRLFDALFSSDAMDIDMRFRENPNKNQLECQLNTGCGDFFRPEDIEVNVKDRNVEFKARREQKSEDGHSYTVREVRRVFTVPENSAVDKLQAEMGPNGKVMLTAPLLKPKPIESKPKPSKHEPVPIKINRK